MKFIAALIQSRKARELKLLASVGLVSEGYQPCPGLPVVTWEHFQPGQRVQLTALTGPWRYVAQTGAIGEVVKLIQGESKQPDDDLYEVEIHQDSSAGVRLYAGYRDLIAL